MTKYIIKRLLLMIFTFFVIMTMCFLLIRLLPRELPQDKNLQAVITARFEALGYNKPLLVQYWIYLKNIFTQGDFGTSWYIQFRAPAFEVLTSRLLPTVLVNLYSFILSVPLGILFGIYAAIKKNKWQDQVISTSVMVFVSVPSYVYAFLVQYIFYFKLNWLPLTVYSLADAGGSWWTKKMFISMILPILALSFSQIAGLTRFTRAELTETLTSDYMLLARTKGLTQREATWNHAFRNSLVPIANTIIPLITGIMGGSLVIEKIFAVPGEGGLLVDSILAGDHFLTVALLIFYSVISLVSICVIDISYGIIDPRIRIGGGK